jgi:hypothetical protein
MLLVLPGQPERGIVTRDREDRYFGIGLPDPQFPRPVYESLRLFIPVYASLHLFSFRQYTSADPCLKITFTASHTLGNFNLQHLPQDSARYRSFAKY